jgi:DNA polymerase V
VGGPPQSIGIGETKVIDKIAQRIAKKSPKTGGVLNLAGFPFLDVALARTEVEDIWGIGGSYARLLRSHSIENSLQFREAEIGWVKKRMGIVGVRMVQELRGVSCLGLETVAPAKKEVTVSRAFGKLVNTFAGLSEGLSLCTTRAAEKLRRGRLAAGAMMVFIMTNRFRDEPQYSNSATIELPVPTDSTDELMAYALCCLGGIYRKGFRFYRAGIILMDLVLATKFRLTSSIHATAPSCVPSTR